LGSKIGNTVIAKNYVRNRKSLGIAFYGKGAQLRLSLFAVFP
jgi:hypothetical protein